MAPLRLVALPEPRAPGVHLRMAGGGVGAAFVNLFDDGGGGGKPEPGAAGAEGGVFGGRIERTH